MMYGIISSVDSSLPAAAAPGEGTPDYEKLVAAALNPDPKFIALREDIEQLVLEQFPVMTHAQQNRLWADKEWREKLRGHYAQYGSATQRDIDDLILAGYFRGEEQSWETLALQKIGQVIGGFRSVIQKILGRART